MRMKAYLSSLSILAMIASTAVPASAQNVAPQNDATQATRSANDALLTFLPFDDKTDFEDAKRGLIAPLPTEMDGPGRRWQRHLGPPEI